MDFLKEFTIAYLLSKGDVNSSVNLQQTHFSNKSPKHTVITI
jgi:hypothetical protein